VQDSTVAANTIIIAWSPAERAAGTAIKRYTITIYPPTTQGQFSFIIDVNPSAGLPVLYTQAIPNLEAGTEYKFTIVARNTNSISSPGENEVFIQTLLQSGPAAPTNLRADETMPATPTSITAKWDSAYKGNGSSISSYTLYVKGGLDFDENFKVFAPLTSYTVTGLTPATPYSVAVVARNETGLSSPESIPITIFTDGEVGPAQPSFINRGATPPPNDNSDISVVWNTASTDGGTNISGYQVSWSPVQIK